jgi:signal transduction histidine kinase
MLNGTLSTHDSRPPAAGAHFVQFYESEDFLFETVATFIGQALANREPVLVLATPAHRRGFTERLTERGFDTTHVIFADARETMDTFMIGNTPDSDRFMARVGGLFEQMTDSGNRISAYGEMVDLLWRDGNPDGAIRLEELWNSLASKYPFSLLCAYPMGNFYKESYGRTFEDICHAHSSVFPGESFDVTSEGDARLREIAILQQRAGALEAEVAHRRELELALREALASRRAVEEELRANLEENARLYELAQQNNRTKDEFLATLSHELRTPLTAILGWARLLTLGTLDENTARLACETIERSARTQASLIDDLLDLSRVVQGKLTLRTERLDLRQVVDNAIETTRLAADARAIRILTRMPEEPVSVIGDPTRLQQISWNLIANAVKFSDPGSDIDVTVDGEGDNARLVVKDAGRGITPEFLPHAFEPFRQGEAATTRHHNGLGLGLAIVKYLAELHGGSVVAQSGGPGSGSTFTVTVPRATA